MATKAKTEEVKVEKKVELDPEEYVEIELFKDGDRYKDSLYVAVNGENCLVPRGVPVKIKRKFADVIRNSIAQGNQAAAEIMRLTNE